MQGARHCRRSSGAAVRLVVEGANHFEALDGLAAGGNAPLFVQATACIATGGHCELPSSVTSIGDSAFYGVGSLISLTIGNNTALLPTAKRRWR